MDTSGDAKMDKGLRIAGGILRFVAFLVNLLEAVLTVVEIFA